MIHVQHHCPSSWLFHSPKQQSYLLNNNSPFPSLSTSGDPHPALCLYKCSQSWVSHIGEMRTGSRYCSGWFRGRDLDSRQHLGSIRSQKCPLLCPEVLGSQVLGLVLIILFFFFYTAPWRVWLHSRPDDTAVLLVDFSCCDECGLWTQVYSTP